MLNSNSTTPSADYFAPVLRVPTASHPSASDIIRPSFLLNFLWRFFAHFENYCISVVCAEGSEIFELSTIFALINTKSTVFARSRSNRHELKTAELKISISQHDYRLYVVYTTRYRIFWTISLYSVSHWLAYPISSFIEIPFCTCKCCLRKHRITYDLFLTEFIGWEWRKYIRYESHSFKLDNARPKGT